MGNIIDRRRLIKAAGISTFTFTLNGCDINVTPREAKKLGADFQSLTKPSVRTLNKLADILLPGANSAGFSYFIDSQISKSSTESLSLLRYMDWPWPHSTFYEKGATAVNAYALNKHRVSFSELDEDDASEIVSNIASSQPDSWLFDAPPAPLFFYVTRADALDVFYGTEDGFELLEIPYIAHIEPTQKW